MAPPKKLNPCTATLDILVPCDLKERVKVLAAQDGRTVSNGLHLEEGLKLIEVLHACREQPHPEN